MTTESKLVACILPAYNAERGISSRMFRESIESALVQTHNNFVLMIVDDGSTDDTLKIAEEYAGCDQRIHIVRNKVNRGVAHARNAGVCAAEVFNPDFACFFGSDDWLKPESFASHVDFLVANPEYVMAGCWYELRDYQGNLKLTVNDLPRRPDRIFFEMTNKVCNIGNPMVHWWAGKTLHWFDEVNFPTHAEDYDFYLKIAERWQISIVPQVLHAIRECSDEYPNSLSYDKANHIVALMRAIRLSSLRRQNGRT